MDRPRSAECDHCEIPRITSPKCRDRFDCPDHYRVNDFVHTKRGFVDAGTARFGNFVLNNIYRQRAVDFEVATRQFIGIEVSEYDVRIGYGRLGAANGVTGRTGVGARAFGSNLDAAAGINPDDAPTTCADFSQVDDRQAQRVASTLGEL